MLLLVVQFYVYLLSVYTPCLKKAGHFYFYYNFGRCITINRNLFIVKFKTVKSATVSRSCSWL